MNEPPVVSLETMTAQAMGEVDPVSGDLVPAIHLSTTFERQTDGSYLQDRVYTRADNPTFEHAEAPARRPRRWIQLRLVRLRDGGDHGDLSVAGSRRPRPRRPSHVLGRPQVAG